MPFHSLQLEGVYALEWRERSTLEDLDQMAREIESLKGRPVGIFRIPASIQQPDEEFRRRQAAMLPTMTARLSAAIMVLEGVGFSASVNRSVATAIIVLTRRKLPIYIRASLEDGLVRDPPPEMNTRGSVLLGRLRAAGFGIEKSSSAREAVG